MEYFRTTCKKVFKGIPFEDLPDVVKSFGGYEDQIVDNFGLPFPICSIKEGYSPEAAYRALGVLSVGYRQSSWVPALHKVGFEKRKIPKDIYFQILNSRQKLLNAGNKWEIEKRCDFGMMGNLQITSSPLLVSKQDVTLIWSFCNKLPVRCQVP